MRAITLNEPYPTLIERGFKTVETRPHPYPWRNAIGETVGIHSAVREAEVGSWVGGFCVSQHINGRAISDYSYEHDHRHDGKRSYLMHPGAMLALAHLDAVVPILGNCGTDMGQPLHVCSVTESSPLLLHYPEWDPCDGETEINITKQRPFGDYTPGRSALLFSNVRQLAYPVHDLGGFHRGLWTVSDEDVARIEAQVA